MVKTLTKRPTHNSVNSVGFCRFCLQCRDQSPVKAKDVSVCSVTWFSCCCCCCCQDEAV